MGSLKQHSDAVESIGFSHTVPMIASAGLDGKLNIWDSNTLQLRQTSTHDEGIVKLMWFPSVPIVATASLDATLRIWDARNGACVKTFQGHQDAILDFEISPDEKFIVSGSDDGSSLVFQI